VSASTISTAHARKAAAKSRNVCIFRPREGDS
jgi:hypothetical protein